MMVVVNLILLGGIATWGYYLSRDSGIKLFYWPALALKLMAGIVLGLIYSHYYPGGDSWAMMAEAIKVKEAAFASFGNFRDIFFHNDYSSIVNYAYTMQPRAAFMTKILAAINLVTNNNYWLTACYLSLFSFAGFWVLANAVLWHFKNKWLAVIPTLFYPSIVFWSSGVLKESVAIGSLALVLAIVARFYFQKNVPWHRVLWLIIGFLLLLQLKYYYAAVLAVSLSSLFIARLLLPQASKWYVELGYILGLFALFMALASLTHPNFWPSRIMEVIVGNYYQFAQKSAPANMVTFNGLEPTVLSLLVHSPKALFSGLFAPVWMSSFSLPRLAAVVENWLLLGAFIYSLKGFSLPKSTENRLFFYVMLLFVLVMAIFISFSTPNYGTLVRFRIGYLLVFVIMIGGGIVNRRKS